MLEMSMELESDLKVVHEDPSDKNSKRLGCLFELLSD